MYKYFKNKAIVKRNIYVWQKSYIQETGNSYMWFLKPVSSEDTLYNGAFWQDFNFHTYENADIITSDVLIIDWEKYQVKWVWKTSWIIIKYKKVLVTKAE